MDRTIQRYITTVLLLITSLSYGQKDIAVVTDSTGSKLVQMTPEKFAYYYQVEKNLRAIEDSLPSLAKSIEDERAATAEAEANLEQQVSLAERMAEIEAQSKEDCIDVATTLEVDNIYLQDKVYKNKRNRKWWFLGGGIAIELSRRFIKGFIQ